MSELDGEGFGDDCDMWFDALSTEDAPLTPRGRSPDSGIVTPPEALTSTDANDSRHDDSGSNEAPQNAADEQRVMFACYDDNDHCDSESKLKSSKRLLRSVSDIGVQCSALLGDCCDSPDDGLSSPIGRVLPLRRSASISDGELAALSGDEDSSDVVDSAVRSSSGENQDQMPGGSRVLRTVPRIGSSSAEARLAARRAARAEARQIRLKEIERRRKEQKEEADGTEDDSGAPVTPLSGASSSCGEPPPPAPQPMASGGLRTMGRLGSTVPSGTGSLSSGSRRSSQDSLNEEKDLPLGLRELRQEYRELEDRFNKAMITNAQLDNEKAAMQYQCENLKDVIVDLREALCRMQKENKLKSRECEAFRRAAESLKEDNRKLKDEITERDMLVQSVGLVMVYSEELDERGRPKRALVTPESAQLLDDAGEGSLDVRIKKFAEEKNELQDTIRRLTLDLEDERNKNSKFTKLMASSSPAANGPSSTDEWIDVQKENNRLVAEYKAKVQRSEQEIVTLQANVARLDSQVTRYKTAAESAEKNEEELKLEKRKLLRELRESQEKLEEAETKRSHLEKRLEKLKNARSALLKEISES